MEKSLEYYKFWLILGRNVKFTAKFFHEVYALKRPLEDIFGLTKSQLIALGLSRRCVEEFIAARSSYTAERVLLELTKNHIEPVFIFENDYPKLLRETYSPPFILYKKGQANLNQFCLGVVGSRRPTDYGIRATEKLASELAASGACIVSGMAIGIDAIAHQAALNEGGVTIAVLGSGLNKIYPSSNVAVARETIASGGAIISEYPFDTPPAKYTFPARNRLISGLSWGIIVTEAAAGSGSLLTANFALEQGREVFAVPGSIFSLNSQGTNHLIASGQATSVSCSQDIYDQFGLACPAVATRQRAIVADNRTEDTIIKLLTAAPKHVDQIIKETGLAQGDVLAAITIMEISAKIKHLGGNHYRLNN